MIGRTNCKRGGSGNVTTVTLYSRASGETITATCTGKSTKTAVTNSSGVATFKNLDMGYDWTFTWSTYSKTEKIDQLTEAINLGLPIVIFHCARLDAGSNSNNTSNVTDSTDSSKSFTLTVKDQTSTSMPATYYDNTGVMLYPGHTYQFGGGMATAVCNKLFSSEPSSKSQTTDMIAGNSGYSSYSVSWTCPDDPPSEIWWLTQRD